MSNFSTAIDGLVTTLEANITLPSPLKVFKSPPDSINQFPAAVILADALDYEIVFGANTFEVTVPLVLLVSSGDATNGFDLLYEHLDPTEASKSVKKAIDTDPSLNGSVDYARVMSANGIGRRTDFGGYFFGAQFLIELVKSVA